MLKNKRTKTSVFRADKEITSMLIDLRREMGTDSFKSFIRKNHQIHTFWSKVFNKKK
jgi:hypothetical protein